MNTFRPNFDILEELTKKYRCLILGSKEGHYEHLIFLQLINEYIHLDGKLHHMTGNEYYQNHIIDKGDYIDMIWNYLVLQKIVLVFCANETATNLTKIMLFQHQVENDIITDLYNYTNMYGLNYIKTSNYINLFDSALPNYQDYFRKGDNHNSIISKMTKFSHFAMLKLLVNNNYPEETIAKYCFDVFHIPYKEGDTLKFNFITGNPPYNSYNEFGTYSKILYVDFVNIANKLCDEYTFIIPAKGALRKAVTNSSADQRLWNELLHDEHFRIDKYYKDSLEIFDAIIEDGVAIVTYDKNSIFPDSDREFFISESHSLITNAYKSINTTNKFSSIVIRYNYRFKNNLFEEYRDVIEEIKKSQGRKKQDEHRLEQWECNEFTFMYSDVYDKDTTYKIWINHSENNFVYVKKEYLDSDYHDIDTYRVAFMASSSSDNYCKKNAKKDFFILEPNELISRRYFSTKSHTKEECENILKYMQTVFFNASFCVQSDNHNRNANSFDYAPLEDFTSKSDVPWDKSIDEIDKYLFNKYNFSDEVIDCIDKAFIHQEKVVKKRGKKTN